MAKMFRAVQAFTFVGRRGPRTFRKDDVVSGRDPDFRILPAHLFEPVDDAAARPRLRAAGVTEDAAAEPNARRTVGRPRGRR